MFAMAQESFRKGAERVYAVLFSRWHIISNPSRICYNEDMSDILKAFSIIHNMIMEFRDATQDICTKNNCSFDTQS